MGLSYNSSVAVTIDNIAGFLLIYGVVILEVKLPTLSLTSAKLPGRWCSCLYFK